MTGLVAIAGTLSACVLINRVGTWAGVRRTRKRFAQIIRESW